MGIKQNKIPGSKGRKSLIVGGTKNGGNPQCLFIVLAACPLV